MDFDFSKLLGRIVEKFGTRKAFCEVASIPESALSYRLSNKNRFTMDEIYRIVQPDCLDIDPAEIGIYFFTPRFDK